MDNLVKAFEDSPGMVFVYTIGGSVYFHNFLLSIRYKKLARLILSGEYPKYWGADVLIGKALDLGKSITVDFNCGIEHSEYESLNYPYESSKKYSTSGYALKLEASLIGRLTKGAGFGFHYGRSYTSINVFESLRFSLYWNLLPYESL